MESAKKAISMTKYFVSLPSARYLAFLIIFASLLAGALTGVLAEKKLDMPAAISGAGAFIVAIAIPALLCAGVVALTRRRVAPVRALALSLSSAIIYSAFLIASAAFSQPNLVFVGFGLSFLLWISVLNFAFGLARSCWIFAIMQAAVFALFMIFALPIFSIGTSDLLAKILLVCFVFVFTLYSLLFLASRPMKKNLGISSNDALSMFASQWLYQDKELEDALDEMGEPAQTWIGVASFKTQNGIMHWVVPYFHFGPFGNLGGSEFSSKISQRLSDGHTCAFVFHGTATHALDPVFSSSIKEVVEVCRTAIGAVEYLPAHFSLQEGFEGDSRCYLLGINEDNICAFTRAPHSTEDVNLAVGWALMEKAKGNGECLAIDCHNCETGDVDYVESGSIISMQMADALEDALDSKKLLAPLLVGWECSYPKDISGIASGGIKVACLDSPGNRPSFYVVLDSNGILSSARDEIITAIKNEFPKSRMLEIFTTDTHELNAVKGVFNPAGEQNLEELVSTCVSLAIKAHENLAPCEFGMKKQRIMLKVLGPYQSAEIVSTINAVVSLLKIAVPVALIGAIFAALWVVGKI
ncbi:MAG: DUF2070 family protein [Candidatus Micrarchaeia archaeon]